MTHGRSESKPDPLVEVLSEEMTAADIVTVLQYMQFRDGFGLLKVDKGVRDFLLRAVRQR